MTVVSILFYLLSSLLYYDYTNTHFPPPDLWHISHQDKGVQEVFNTTI